MFNKKILKKIKDDEKIISVERRHWGSFIKQAVISLLIITPPFFFIDFFLSAWIPSLIFLGIILIGFLYGFFSWVKWYLNGIIITNKRLIYIKQKSIFSKKVAETPIINIQDITYEVSGILASIFSFGTVTIVSGGSIWNVEKLADPEGVQDYILQLREKIIENSEE